MHSLGEEEDLITREIIGKAIGIHRVLGPGLLESVYEYFLVHELRKADLYVEQQKPISASELSETRQHRTWAFDQLPRISAVRWD